MTHMNEAFCVYIPEQEKKQCPFCDEEAKKQYEDKASRIGVHNDGKKLGENLKGTSKTPTGFTWPEDGLLANYDSNQVEVRTEDMRAEAHHLLPGKQALHATPKLEEWLVHKTYTVAKDGKSKTGPESGSWQLDGADTGFDVNAADNGIWLPSVPVGGKWNWEKPECKAIAFKLMEETNLQFHKGEHADKGTDDSHCYVRKAKRLLGNVHEFVQGWSEVCEKKPKEANAKFPPPYGVNALIYNCANVLRMDVSRHPATWTVFISKIAFAYHEHVKSEQKEVGKKAGQAANKAPSDARRKT